MSNDEELLKKLQESEEKLRSFMDSATNNFFLWDSKLNIIDINKEALNGMGLSKQEIIGKNIVDIIPDVKESGRYDEYIRSFGRELAAFSQKIFLRTMHEMNGNWYPWCGSVNGNSAELHIAAWNHIRDLINREALSGIEWVWSPYAHSYPDQPSNSMEEYFPGDDSLDLIAIDGYNWGSSKEWSTWQSFEEIFGDAYDKLSAISQRPFMIGETASDESGGSKEDWITEAFDRIKTRFNKIESLIWFDEKKECDWRIDSSSASLKAFQNKAS